MWLDELHEVAGTFQRTWGELLYWSQISPGGTPLNFAAQKIVLDTFGFSSFTVRLPAILFGAASLWVFIRIVREGTTIHWPIAATVFALLPQIFRYGVEARPYSQGLFFALLAFWFWTQLERDRDTRQHAILFGLTVAACLYSQVYSVFAPLGLATWSLRRWKKRTPVLVATTAAVFSYVPWFLIQRETQLVAQAGRFAFDWANFSILGFVRELSGGGYFCSLPLLLLASLGAFATKDLRLIVPAAAALVGPLIADAALGYFFAGRQLIFALPFLILLAIHGAAKIPKSLAAVAVVLLLAASIKYDFRQATTTREDWQSPAHKLASYDCIFVWGPDQLQYLRVYEPGLRQCDVGRQPSQFAHVTTRYSPPTKPPNGYSAVQRESVGIAEIVLYRRDASLKTYGLSRFFFRP